MKQKNRILLSASLLSVSMSVNAEQNKISEPKAPNIIYILADDLGYGDVSYLNEKSLIQTSNIDNIAKAGICFTDAHSSSSVSTPSRYSILTGRYAWKTRLKRGVLRGVDKSLMKPGRNTVASILKNKNYNTACIGKWHLGMDFQLKEGKELDRIGENIDYSKLIMNGPNDFGFDYFFGIPGSMDMSPYVLVENNKFFEQPNLVIRKRHPYGRPGTAIKSRGPEYFLPTFTDKVEEKITQFSKSDKPFFIYFPLNAPHTPVAPSKKFLNKSKIGKYGDFVLEVDNVVGRVKNLVKKLNIEENTIIIITSDNGPEVNCYNRFLTTDHSSSGYLKGVKRDLWEGGHRVPFIVQWPKQIKEGTICKSTICLSDFFATVSQIVGYESSAQEGEDSYSFLAQLKGSQTEVRPHTIHHSAHGDFAIRKGQWVFIEKGKGGTNANQNKLTKYYKKLGYTAEDMDGYLYNLDKDIREFKDLAKQNKTLVKEMKKILENSRNGYEK